MDVQNGKPFASTDDQEFTLNLKGATRNELVFMQAHSDNSGTIQVAIGEAVGADHMALAAGDKYPPITVPLNVDHIRLKASAADQKMTITW